MAGRHWTVFLSALASCVSQIVSLADLYFHARAEPNKFITPVQYTNISFTLEKYKEFQHCLSDQSKSSCVIKYSVATSDHNVISINPESGTIKNQTSYAFHCENDASTQSMNCTRQYHGNLGDLCTRWKNYQFYSFNNSDCIGFMWRDQREYFDSQLAAVQSCDGCNRTTTSTTTSASSTATIGTSGTSTLSTSTVSSSPATLIAPTPTPLSPTYTTTITATPPIHATLSTTTTTATTNPTPLAPTNATTSSAGFPFTTTITTITFTTVPTHTDASTTVMVDPAVRGDDTGIIIGIVFGVITALLCIIAAVYLFMRKPSKISPAGPEDNRDQQEVKDNREEMSDDPSNGLNPV